MPAPASATATRPLSWPFRILLAIFAVAGFGCAAYGPPRVWGETVHRHLVFAAPRGMPCGWISMFRQERIVRLRW